MAVDQVVGAVALVRHGFAPLPRFQQGEQAAARQQGKLAL
jgi:hypothetical protein